MYLLQTSLMSATSLESRCGGQVFATTGQYRGVVVRIKELKFSKKKDVTRETMKEMRRLVEPQSFQILLTLPGLNLFRSIDRGVLRKGSNLKLFLL